MSTKAFALAGIASIVAGVCGAAATKIPFLWGGVITFGLQAIGSYFHGAALTIKGM